MSLDFIFGLPPDSGGNTGVVVFVDRFSKVVHIAAVPAEVTAKQTARLLVDMVFKHHGMPTDIVSDRDPRFTAHLWQELFTLLGSQLSVSTADHPQTDGQTERVNRVLVDILKSYAHSLQYWSECLSMAEFAINNSVHASTGHTPFYVNAMRHPRLPSLLGVVAPTLSGGGSTTATQQSQKAADTCAVSAATTKAKTTRSTQGADSSNNKDKDHGSAPGADTSKNRAKTGPVAESELNDFGSDATNFITKRERLGGSLDGGVPPGCSRREVARWDRQVGLGCPRPNPAANEPFSPARWPERLVSGPYRRRLEDHWTEGFHPVAAGVRWLVGIAPAGKAYCPGHLTVDGR
ncbi:hypothetical protein ON010_g368 [Phytophthora cinnamomi]|nr:hypothetical protein ON010_g368 [Phytophthora cinnamomi]